jgi:type III secretory pathway lipoprotein EscJ
MNNELVVVYTAAGQTEANLIKSLLEAAGIPAMTSQEGAGAAYGLTVGPLGEARILVREKDAAEARELLAAMERGEPDEEEGESSVPEE